jgi:hypothetical protein
VRTLIQPDGPDEHPSAPDLICVPPGAGILHHDIGPHSVCMGKGPMANEVYLMDFGRAEVYTETMTNIHRLAETGAGNPRPKRPRRACSPRYALRTRSRNWAVVSSAALPPEPGDAIRGQFLLENSWRGSSA